jgi:flagellar biosynthesis GTPase FlhF
VGAPPVINVGMRVNGNVERNSHNTTINDNRVTNNVTNITNVRNVTIVAPPTAMANGRGFQQAVVADAHRPPEAHAGARPTAPKPQSTTAVAAWQPGHAPPALPPAQPVRGVPHGATPPRPVVTAPAGEQSQHMQRPDEAQQVKDRQEQAQRAQQQAPQQNAQHEQQQKAQQEQAQRAQQAQQQAAQREQQQKAQQEQAQRAQQQKAQPEPPRAQPEGDKKESDDKGKKAIPRKPVDDNERK